MMALCIGEHPDNNYDERCDNGQSKDSVECAGYKNHSTGYKLDHDCRQSNDCKSAKGKEKYLHYYLLSKLRTELSQDLLEVLRQGTASVHFISAARVGENQLSGM